MDPDQGFLFFFFFSFYNTSELREGDRFPESREGGEGARRGADLDERTGK